MGSALYPTGLQKILDDTIALASDNIKCGLIDLNDEGVAITNVVNNGSGLCRVTATGHGLSTGNKVMICRVVGVTNANGYWIVTAVDANTLDLQGSSFSGTYTSGGYVVKLTRTFLADLAANALVASSANLGTKTFTNGTFDAADTTFTAVTGDPCEAWIVYEDTGAGATSSLISISDRKADDSEFAITPNGGDINLQFAAAGIFTIQSPFGTVDQ